ncbi:MAG TPA: 50S ribosomal protein L25 [Thiothrix sp.]|nr:50S ribosomal protein L25 [Thiothrix sp.]
MLYHLDATLRTAQQTGKGASRRLRRDNQTPAIIYGGGAEPSSVALLHKQMVRGLMDAEFYEHVITLKFEGSEEKVVLQDLQRHPYKPTILHADFKRATAEQIAATEAVMAEKAAAAEADT